MKYRMTKLARLLPMVSLFLLVALVATSCANGSSAAPLPQAATQTAPAASPAPAGTPLSQTMGDMHGGTDMQTATASQTAQPGSPASYVPNVSYTLKTNIAEGKLVFVGVGGAIDGKPNPTLQVNLNDVVQVTLINDDGAVHDVAFPDFSAQTEMVTGKGASSSTVFRAGKPGEYTYYCTVPGHRQAGMEGKLVVGQTQQPAAAAGPSVSRDPADVPAPVGNRGPQNVRVDLETTEVEGRLADNTTYTYWTFNGKVPGPMVRARVGDTIEIHLKNNPGSKMIHSIDLHAVTGPGGGASVTQVPPGQEKSFTFKALNPGLYVYHCATPMVANHISNGMYGMILIEPEGGLPKVDHEFYVMQGEIYTRQPFGQTGRQEFDVQKLLDEQPEYFVLNGSVAALTQEHPLHAKTGETVRIFFGDGGPNFVSSFHVIGEIFDRVYDQGSLTAAPLTNVQTTLVPTGGATMVEFKTDVPGRYILVDHSLSRMERGLVGFLMVDGPDNPEVFRGETGK